MYLLCRIASFDGDAAVAAPCLTSCNRSFASGEAASESLAKISPRYGPGGIGATEIPTPSDLDESGTDAAATVQGESSSSFIGEVTAADNTVRDQKSFFSVL